MSQHTHCPICNKEFETTGYPPEVCEHHTTKYRVLYWDDDVSTIHKKPPVNKDVYIALFHRYVPLDDETIERWLLLV